ncbi:hypothetical protein TWF481_007330 [Arthrobotrys musiformis]|uniref:Ataxin-2 C-terminal domain-containing protein n=1 Tax=Arthrobotrys musiformis TaxID=47236 RepID=A0AAV9WCS1_9PEZI
MSTVADNVKPAEEFVVFTDDSSSTPREDKTNADAAPPTNQASSVSASDPQSSLDKTTLPPPQPSIARIDSFPKTLPLPASSILSPVSAVQKQDLLPSLSEQKNPPEDVISPPSSAAADMLFYTNHTGATTPLAELAGTAFDQQVALRRRGDSILGEEISEGVSKLNVEAEATPPLVKEISLPPREVFTAEELAARKNNPAVVSALPQTPSAEDFEVAKIQTGANFTPEFTETKVAS